MTTVAMESNSANAGTDLSAGASAEAEAPAHENTVIRLDHVSKRFDGRAVLDDVSIEVPQAAAF